jgi:hypothetical protein
MIEFNLPTFKIIAFIHNITEQSQTNILSPLMFFSKTAVWYEILWNFMEVQAGKRPQYTRDESHGSPW